MTARSTQHASFTIDRTYPASPARVFNVWATPAEKLRWFACHDEWPVADHRLDFRPGGREQLRTGPKGGTVHAYDAVYFDIVPNERIVYAYEMRLDDRRITVSLATVEFIPTGTGTQLRFTEQAVFLDGYDEVADREHGTRLGLDNLEKILRQEVAGV